MAQVDDFIQADSGRHAGPGKAGVLASNDQLSRGGNAPQPVVSDGSRLVWLALAVIPMGWLSAVGVIQHLHRNIISSGRSRGGLDPDAELVRANPFLSRWILSRVGGGKSTSTTSTLVKFSNKK